MGSPQIRSSRTNNALWLCVVLGLLTAPPAWAETQAERGEYLATIMDCHGCHTNGALAGKPDPALHLAGSSIGFEIPTPAAMSSIEAAW